MSGLVTVYATFGSAEEAERIGRQLVEERHAACANILGGCRSIYRWEGEVQQADEVAALFKTTAGQAPALLQRLASLHSYDVPAAVVWPIDQTGEAYRQWVMSNSGR